MIKIKLFSFQFALYLSYHFVQSHATLGDALTSMTLGTQEEAEAGAGHAAQQGVMTVEGIAAPAQDVAAALQNRDRMRMIGFNQVAVGVILTTVATAPLPTGPGQRAGTP